MSHTTRGRSWQTSTVILLTVLQTTERLCSMKLLLKFDTFLVTVCFIVLSL